MNTTTPIKALAAAVLLTFDFGLAAHAAPVNKGASEMNHEQTVSDTLSARQQAIPLIAASMASSQMDKLNAALNQGLDAGLTINETKEILVQLYAYTGFPRSLNALNELMKVVEARKQRGIEDVEGKEPLAPIPVGDELRRVGTANQTKISGAPVKGPLFDFAPVINQFLQAHLFGDIFARDNLDWQSRELATVGALAATPGVEAQLLSHGGPGWYTAMKNDKVKAIVAFEPGSSFVFPEKELPAPMPSAFDTLKGEPVPMEQFMALTKIPILIIYGDNIPDKPVAMPAQDSWRVRLVMAREWRDVVNKHGGDVTVTHLPEVGIKGNTHFPFSDLNNVQIADLVSQFLKEKDLQ